MTGTRLLSDRAVDPTRCRHPTRVRESHWGWYSVETGCLTCRQAGVLPTASDPSAPTAAD
jgi:hypothetical protein